MAMTLLTLFLANKVKVTQACQFRILAWLTGLNSTVAIQAHSFSYKSKYLAVKNTT
jgi:hypothetical protein